MSSSPGSRFAKLFLSQLGFKIISFAITSILTRALLPSAKGIGFLFEMYFTAGSFLCRESVRSLHARLPLTPDKIPAMLGSGFFCALVGLSIVIPLSLLHASTYIDPQLRQILFADENNNNSLIGFFSTAIVIAPSLCLVFLIEMLAESHWNLATFYRGGIEDKATAESWGLIAKNLAIASVVYFPTIMMNMNAEEENEFTTLQRATIGFAAGHAAYSLLFYLLSARTMATINNNNNNNNKNEIVSYPKIPQDNFIKIGNTFHFTKFQFSNLKNALSLYFLDPKTKAKNDAEKNSNNDNKADAPPNYLMSQFIQENILRLTLTEGEKFVLTSSGVVSLSAQGAFEVASSLGKLVTRILFKLWEEFCFNEWAKGAASIASSLLARENQQQQQQQKYQESDTLNILQSNLDLLQNMCRLATSIGVLACCFGPLLSGRILQLLFGSRWANKEASDILAIYLLSLPLFGLNGLLEAFCRALSSPLEMKKARSRLLMISVSYLTAAFCALRYFSHGDVKVLIAVNGIQFILRILIGLSVSKEIVDRIRNEIRTSSMNHQQLSWKDYLKDFCPSKYFLAFCTLVGVAGSFVISPYSSRFDLEGEDQNYVVPFKKDLILMVLGAVACVVAVVSDPTAMERIKNLLKSRRKQQGENNKPKEE